MAKKFVDLSANTLILMVRSLLFSVLLLFLVVGDTFAQSNKPVFKEFTYVAYHTEVSKGVTHIVIENYVHINNTGVARYVSSIYNGGEYSGTCGDTTYKLNDTTTADLNKVLDGKTELKSHIATSSLQPGTHYAGLYECIIYTDQTGKTDHLLFIASYLDPQLYGLVNNVIYRLPTAYGATKPAYRNPLLEAKIAAWYKMCNCMPKIESPPGVVEMLPGM
jgi:hypothetical protein